MEMIILVLQVLSAAAILVAAAVFYRGVIKSKKPFEIKIDQPEFDQDALRVQLEFLMGEVVNAFQVRLRELAQQNAELAQIGVWADQIDSVDLDELSDDVAKRVKVLRIKKAEEAVVEAESALTLIRKEVRFYVEKHASDPYSYKANKVKHVKDQEAYAMKYLETAQERLTSLVGEATSKIIQFNR